MLRWAILGTGFISNTVVDAISRCDSSVVALVAGRDAASTEAFQAQHGIGRSTLNMTDAATDPAIDAVYVGTPNHHHHPLVIAAAEAGKAVLSEKSLTTTMDTAHALVDAVRDRVFFVEGLMYLAHPLFAEFIDLLQSARIGTIKEVHARYAADIAAVVNPLGRGTIYNLGCYPVSLLQLTVQTTFGPAAFSAHTLHGAGSRTVDGTIGAASAVVRFDNDVLATVASTDNYGMAHDFTVVTDRGELRFETNPWLPVAGDNVMSWRPYDGQVERIVVHDDHDAFVHQIRLVEAAVAAGATQARRPSPRLDDSLEIMSFLTAWEAICLASSR